jgi:hypothetical protein
MTGGPGTIPIQQAIFEIVDIASIKKIELNEKKVTKKNDDKNDIILLTYHQI